METPAPGSGGEVDFLPRSLAQLRDRDRAPSLQKHREGTPEFCGFHELSL